MFKYCYCGKQNSNVANFCQACGKPFASLSLAKEKPKEKLKAKLREPDPEDDEEEISEEENEPTLESVPSIESLGYEIIQREQPKTTVGDLISAGGSKTTKIEGKGVKTPKISKKAILEEYRREAGAIRPKK